MRARMSALTGDDFETIVKAMEALKKMLD
jgi:hypothetical protein